ncbi:hypothetical protein [Rathayibacter agropyri]|uniref:hypothetical protein n=1 Tax=Rathayibacter agropyri TaxID=1634927 RepID=UPI001567A2D4|nr:hypothetical protein [Rathayibacter agropyri]NRD09508.1 hypothetical protein [Rathayibacter agropyri]
MMASARDLRVNVASYLARNGWQAGSGGGAGELWTQTRPNAGDVLLAVPYEVDQESFEFNALVERLAMHERRDVVVIRDALESEFLDTQSYRVSDRFVRDDAALLGSAFTILNSARKLLRAAATTARKPRPRIGSNYSRPADELAAKARLSHTRRGSFVVPIVMPVDPPASSDGQLDSALAPIEPSERRVTRTLASAVTAIDTIAIKPEKEPGPDEIMGLVQSGVSMELVAAVRDIALDPGVEAFDTSFRWAAALGAPGRMPDRVVIPREAASLLGKVALTLGRTRPEPEASVSGQIVQIRYVQDDPTGELAIRVERTNRQADIFVTVSSDVIHDAYVWARNHRAVLARGLIERSPGRPLAIPNPTDVVPIDVLFNITIDSSLSEASER